MAEAKKPDNLPPVMTAHIDLSTVLGELVKHTGTVQESYGGFKIKVFHTRAFPWAEVFKELLYRNFRVDVGRHKADLYIEARP